MRKRFVIPLINVEFRVFIGESEWGKFHRQAKSDGARWIKPTDITGGPTLEGQAIGGNIWIGFPEDESLIDHELSHLLDNLMRHIGSRDTELRAYIAGWVGPVVRKWIGDVMAGTTPHTGGDVCT